MAQLVFAGVERYTGRGQGFEGGKKAKRILAKKGARMMAINSKKKGKAGELEWVQFCKEHGFDESHRTAQYCGNTGDASDVIGLPGIHQEVKRVESLNVQTAIEQAIRDSKAEGKESIPIVAHRRNRKEWLVTMRAEDWFKLYREWESGQRG